MTTDDITMVGNLSKEEMDRYTEEAREKWGSTAAFKQSEERMKKIGKAGLDRVMKESDLLIAGIARCMQEGHPANGKEAQMLISKHYEWLRAFYEPNCEIYAGLAAMYVADERFKSYYERVADGLAEYMHDAMVYFVETKEETLAAR